MKRIGYVLILAAISSAGCTPGIVFFQDDKKPPKVEIKPLPAPPAVTPDSISEKNAKEKAKALREELEFELRQRPLLEADPVEGSS